MTLFAQKQAEQIHVPLPIEEWPIYLLAQNRDKFREEFIKQSKQHILKLLSSSDSSNFEESDKPSSFHNFKKLHDELEKTLYLEKIRIKNDPWSVDPPDDKEFWNNINNELVQTSIRHKGSQVDADVNMAIFDSIVERYATEIISNFSPSTYKWASKVLQQGFAGFFNKFTAKRFWNTLTNNKFAPRDHIAIAGPVDHILELSQKGTLLLVPTHFSNLDSVVIGWAIHTLGLPAFLYGAGLNLFNSKIFGYFMDGLGAYRVDRRKKSRIYIETLKMYSQMTLREGCHGLFFPGGTRSRNGALESKLKLGLLGSAIEAQRLNLVEGKTPQLFNPKAQSKIFVVPLVLNYNVVFEAQSLIEQYLEQSGKEKYYIDRDAFPNRVALMRFLRKFLFDKSDITLSFGSPIDVFGNLVDWDGNSLDKKGNAINIDNYFKTNGEFREDDQRDSEYAITLGDTIVQQYLKYNVVLPSHLVAFIAFELFKRKYQNLDLYGLLRLPANDESRNIPYEVFVEVVERLRTHLRHMEEQKQVRLANQMYGDVHRLIRYGIRTLGVYHSTPPLSYNKKENAITTQNMILLYYYHNRLEGYELHKLIEKNT